MSKRQSPRVTVDWVALQADADAAGPPHADYVHALQKALEGRDHAPLLEMLDFGEPVATRLAPILAEVLRAALDRDVKGRPRKLTAREDKTVRFLADNTDLRATQKDVAKMLDVKPGTVKRSLKRTKR